MNQNKQWVVTWRDARSGRPASLAVPATGLRIGRAPTNEIVVDDPMVSRVHAVVNVLDGKAYVDASRSTNGILVGGREVRTASGDPGLTFRVGSVSFAVSPSESVPALARPAQAGGRRAPALAVAGIAVVGVVAIGAVLAGILLNGGDAETGGSDQAGAEWPRSQRGSPFDASMYSDSWGRRDLASGRVSLAVPPEWTVEEDAAGTLRLFPPGGEAAGGSAAITVVYVDRPYAAGDEPPAGSSEPEVITIDGVRGRSFEDMYLGLPFTAATIEVPVGGGILTLVTPIGPVTDYSSQTEEILRGLTIQ